MRLTNRMTPCSMRRERWIWSSWPHYYNLGVVAQRKCFVWTLLARGQLIAEGSSRHPNINTRNGALENCSKRISHLILQNPFFDLWIIKYWCIYRYRDLIAKRRIFPFVWVYFMVCAIFYFTEQKKLYLFWKIITFVFLILIKSKACWGYIF